MQHIVGISEMVVTSDPEDVIVTYSLGSCVGLSLYDPVTCVGGMIHCMLPLSKSNKEKASEKPCMFVDTGLTALLQGIFDKGAQRDRIIAKVAGGGMLLDSKRMFKIGERNYTVLRKILWKNNILIAGEDVGGTRPRTMFLHMNTGATIIKSRGEEAEL